MSLSVYFFFNDTATTDIYTLSLHDALPIWRRRCVRPPRAVGGRSRSAGCRTRPRSGTRCAAGPAAATGAGRRSEEHTSELQSRRDLVCRLLLEKKKKNKRYKDNAKVKLKRE